MTNERDDVSRFLESPEFEAMMTGFSDWHVDRLEPDEGSVRQEYIIRSGEVALRLSVDDSWAFLNWAPEIPAYLRPGRDVKGFNEFKDFIGNTLPKKIFGLHPDDDYSKDYQEHTIVTIGPTIRIGKKEMNYGLATEDERVKLATEFIAKSKYIKSIAVSGRGIHGNELGSYYLNIVYPQIRSKGANLSIGLPLCEESPDWWNEDVLFWAIDTHSEKAHIEDLTASSQSLGLTISSIIEEEVFGSKREAWKNIEAI